MNKKFDLGNQQKQLIFDYSLGLISEEATVGVEQLIVSNEQAAEIHSKLRTVLSPLKILESESCPDDLAESTILRLKSLADGKQ